MLAPVWLRAVIALFTLGSLARAGEFPYTAYVNTDNIYVRSGPSKDSYPTDKFSKGKAVEVYRLDPGGWCAIRPPEGSFSWVARRDLELEGNRIGVASIERATVRVGSALDDSRDAIQLHLDKGERLEVLETVGDWHRVAPPAGEFRWIARKFLDRNPPGRGDEYHSHEYHGEARRSDDHADGPRKSDFIGSIDCEHCDSPVNNLWRVPNRVRGERIVERVSMKSTETSRESDNGEFDRSLDRVNLDLSQAVAEDIKTWSLAPLRRRAEELLDHADNSNDRAQARDLLGRLERFEELKQRSDTLAATPAAPAPSIATRERRRRLSLEKPIGQPPLLGASSAAPSATPSATPTTEQLSEYDGIGRLERVGMRTMRGPQFALLDASGAIVCYVTPVPGLTLAPYQGRQVGVRGSRSYLPDLGRQHITAQRVSLLGDSRTARR